MPPYFASLNAQQSDHCCFCCATLFRFGWHTGESTELELSPSSNASKSFGKEQDDKDIEQSAGILAASHGTGLDDVSLDDGDDDDRGSSRAAVVPT